MKTRFKMPKIGKIDLKAMLSRLYNRTNGKAPDILMWIGTAGVIGGTVMACKASTEMPGILGEYREKKNTILEGDDAEGQKKEIRKLRMQTAGKIAKLYAPAAAVEGVGLLDMHCANHTLKIVNTELVGTVLTLNKAIEKIRENVREEFGEEGEEKIMHGGWDEKEVTKTDEEGNEYVEKVRVYKRNGMPSPYARWFAFGEADAAEESEYYNEKFLEIVQNQLPHYLRANRKVYLNDVYRMLGIRESIAGNRVGWLYDPKNPMGDNYIDLRIQQVRREKDDGSGEWETAFLIDPNVDGCIDEKALAMGLMDE